MRFENWWFQDAGTSVGNYWVPTTDNTRTTRVDSFSQGYWTIPNGSTNWSDYWDREFVGIWSVDETPKDDSICIPKETMEEVL